MAAHDTAKFVYTQHLYYFLQTKLMTTWEGTETGDVSHQDTAGSFTWIGTIRLHLGQQAVKLSAVVCERARVCCPPGGILRNLLLSYLQAL